MNMFNKGRLSKVLPFLLLAAVIASLFVYYAFAAVDRVMLDSPANGTWSASHNVTFNCTAVTNSSEVEVNVSLWMATTTAAGLTWNATNQTAATNATTIAFNITNIPDGAYLWTCEATNLSAVNPVSILRNTTNYTVYVDTAVPHTIALNSLTSGTNSTSSVLNFNWTASDAFSAFAATMTCNLTIDGVINKTIAVTNGTMANSSITGFADGRHEWNISSCNDSALNTNTTGSEMRYLYVDTAVPHTIALNSLSSGTNISSTSLNFNWTATDAGSLVMTCNLTIDGVINKTVTVASGVMSNFTVAGFAQGRHEWNISSCNDSNGFTNSSGSGLRYLYVDTVVPHTIALNSLSSSPNSTSSVLNFNWTANDTTATVMTCNLTIDGRINKTITVTSGVMANSSITGFADGRHEWNISSCNDSALNTNTTGSEMRYLYVDTAVPHTIALNSLTDGTNLSSISPNFNWTATDAGASVMTCNLTIDRVINKTVTAASGVMSNFTVAGFAQGRHEWNISSCNDSNGFTNSSGSVIRYFTVDTVAPVITLTVSPSSVYQLTSAVTIGCDATDATDTSATSASMTVKLPNDAYSSDLDGTFTDTSLVGTYTVTCSKTDSAGNSASSSTTFSVASGSVSTGSSGGGGGGSAAPVTESRTLPSVVADTPTTFTLLSQNTIGVNEVVFTPTEGALAVAVTVSKVSSLPSTVSAAPTGEVSSYLKIEVPKLVGKVSDAKIKFEVLKSWLASKGVNANDIVLQRYTTGWDKLPTTKLREDSTKVYFEATTPGFSYFAVTTKAVAAPAGEEAEEAPAEEAPAEEAPAEAAETPAEVPAEKTGSMLWVYVVAALIVIAVAVVVIVKRKK